MICFMEIVTHTRERILSREQRCVWDFMMQHWILSVLYQISDYTYYIQGTNFTPSSQVKLNGEWYDTVYVSPTTLVITGTELKDFDRLSVDTAKQQLHKKAVKQEL